MPFAEAVERFSGAKATPQVWLFPWGCLQLRLGIQPHLRVAPYEEQHPNALD
jgi:hypothetical protein